MQGTFLNPNPAITLQHNGRACSVTLEQIRHYWVECCFFIPIKLAWKAQLWDYSFQNNFNQLNFNSTQPWITCSKPHSATNNSTPRSLGIIWTITFYTNFRGNSNLIRLIFCKLVILIITRMHHIALDLYHMEILCVR